MKYSDHVDDLKQLIVRTMLYSDSGGGPTGLVMAIALAKYGISVHEAFEKDS